MPLGGSKITRYWGWSGIVSSKRGKEWRHGIRGDTVLGGRYWGVLQYMYINIRHLYRDV